VRAKRLLIGETEIMQKRTKILAISVLAIIVVATFVAYFQMKPSTNQLPTGNPQQWQIKVSGEVKQEVTTTLKEMTQMPLTTVNTVIDGENATYKGVTLLEFCERSGMDWDAGAINIISANGDEATVSVFQAWNSTSFPRGQNNSRIMLAFVKNGQWMSNGTGGPVRLIAPDFSDQYQLESVAEVNIGLWTMSVSGAVSNPLTITGENVTDFQQTTVHSEFVPGDEPNRTSDWTGASMMSVLNAAKMSNTAETVTIIAVDGYEQNFTISQIQAAQMQLGYMENGKALPLDQGGPFRLFLPTQEYKWGYYWVKFVKEIVVT
jgi:DMSO/TMAO reductase YedYZ molybdopterin-dependent catalytic subunit